METENESEIQTFVDFPHLLYREKLQPGTLASAVELHGVYTWDRFGRLKHYLLGSPEAERALNLLAAYYHQNYISMHAHAYDIFEDPEQDVYGWPTEKRPNFKEFDEGITFKEKTRDPDYVNTKSRNAFHGIILGMLKFIKGELDNKPHPNWQNSESALAKFIEVKMAGYPGISAENLTDRFTEAKKLISKNSMVK